MGNSNLAAPGATALQESAHIEPVYVLKCGKYYVGNNVTSRVSTAEHAKRFSEDEANEALQRLQRSSSLYPLPYEAIEIRRGVR